MMPVYIFGHLNYLCESHSAVSQNEISKSAFYCSYIMAPYVPHPTDLVMQHLKISARLQKLHKMI